MAIETYEHVITGHLAGQFVQTVLHSTIDNSGSYSPYMVAQDLNNHFIQEDELLQKFLEVLPAEYKGSSLRTRRVGPTGGPTAIALASEWEYDEGQLGNGISSQQVNPLLIWIPVNNPAKTGRVFFPGCAEAQIDNGVLQSGIISAMTAFGDYMDSGWTVAAGTGKGAVLRRATKTGDPIGYHRVSPLIGTQRRRLRPV